MSRFHIWIAARKQVVNLVYDQHSQIYPSQHSDDLISFRVSGLRLAGILKEPIQYRGVEAALVWCWWCLDVQHWNTY